MKADQSSWLSRILARIPAPLLKALDAWSYRVALRHAERRRLAQAARQRKAAPVAQYKRA